MVQIKVIKEDTALPIGTLITISKEEIDKLKQLNKLFKSMYDTLSDDENQIKNL